MHFTTTAFAAAGLAAHQAFAFGGSYGGGWGGSSYYSTPDNTNNECSPEQASGYNWGGLSQGSFDSYGSNKFSGWSCSNSFGKRDLLTKRTFQSKCITAPLDDQPSIGCEDDKTMSLDKFEVSSDKDADIECHYDMPDGSTCKEVHSCSAGGTVIQNSQCGGAKSVTFKPHGGSSGCNIGVHSVGFNCGSASSAPPAYSSTAPPSYSTPSAPAYSSESSSASIPVYSSPSESSPAVYPTSTPSAPGYGSSSSESVPAYSSSSPVETSPATYPTTTESAPGYSSSSESSPAVYPTESSPAVYTTSTPSAPEYESSTTESIPVYSGSSSSESSPSTPTVPAYSTGSIPSYNITSSYPIGSGSAPGYSSPTAPAYGSSSTENSPVTTSSVPTGYTPKPESPDTLPKCLNSWMYLTSCKGNDDYDCFCKDKEFMTKVYGCISAWSGSHDDTQGSTSYLMGLCAPYVPQNPAIITACPSTVTPAASYSYSPQTSSPAESAPVYQPQGQTITLYSTKEETITSCAPEVTNCPAKTQTTSYAVGTTVTTAPGEAPSSTENSPVGTSPAVTPPASVPCTTITYSTVYPVPATYSTGESVGATIPSSSITTSIYTTVTVPQVQITTYTVTSGGSTTTQPGLGYGPPATTAGPTAGPTEGSPAPAYPSAPAPAPYPTTSPAGPVGPVGGSAAPSGMGTTYLPSSSPSSSPITPYTGAGAKLSGSSLVAIALGAVALLM